MIRPPQLVVIAGPNGAGKSTTAPVLLHGVLGIKEFVNADVIAQGLSGFSPESTAIAAGEIMLQRLRDLAEARRDFAFETTLASRTYAAWIQDLQASGYRFRLVFLWLPSSGMAVMRVQQRVSTGGHHVDRETVIRRYRLGLRNFFGLYRPIADDWRIYNNSVGHSPRLIAAGKLDQTTRVADADVWQAIQQEYGHD